MNILDQIIEKKRQEIKHIPLSVMNVATKEQKKSLSQQLTDNRLHLIAEVKKSSPSKGVIYEDFDHLALAQTFEQAGASCISVLTDEFFFKGHKQYLMDIQSKVSIPVLRKDFIIDPIQVYESCLIDADVILVILDILSTDQANEIMGVANQLGLEVLLEIHSEDALHRVRDLESVTMIGVNNRDLNTFIVNKDHALNFSSRIQQFDLGVKIIAESGYDSINDLETLKESHINGVLIGEGLSKESSMLTWFNNES